MIKNNELTPEKDNLIELLALKASRRAEEILDQKRERQTHFFVAIVTLASMFMIGIIAFAMNAFIHQAVEDAIKEERFIANQENLVRSLINNSMDQNIGPIENNLKETTDLFEFSTFATFLDIDGGFTKVERDNTMELLKRISKSNAYKSSRNFPVLLEKTIDALFEADQQIYVDQIDNMYHDVMITNTGITFTMIQYYGQSTLLAESKEEFSRNNEKLLKYKEATKNLDQEQLANLALIFDCLILIQAEEKGSSIDELSYRLKRIERIN